MAAIVRPPLKKPDPKLKGRAPASWGMPVGPGGTTSTADLTRDRIGCSLNFFSTKSGASPVPRGNQ